MLQVMTLGRELQKALREQGLSAAEFARRLGHRNSGLVTQVIKDLRPIPEAKLTQAVEMLDLKGPAREQFLREALLSYLPDDVRPLLRQRFHLIDQLVAKTDKVEAAYQRLVAEVRAR